MAKYYYNFTTRSPGFLAQAQAGTGSGYRAYAQYIRDLFRGGDGVSDFVNQPLGSNWKVSDIALHTVTIYDRLYAFLMRNTTTKEEFLFLMFGLEAINNAAEITDIFGATITYFNYTRSGSETSLPSSSTYTTFMIMYNHDYTIDSFDTFFNWDDSVELTYTGGDFTSLAAIPTSDATWQSLLHKSHMLHYYHFSDGSWYTFAAAHKMMIIIDEELGYFKIQDAFIDNSNTQRNFWVASKNMFLCSDPNDSNTAGTIFSRVNSTTTSNSSWDYTTTDVLRASGHDLDGVRQIYSGCSYQTPFVVSNCFDEEGKIKWTKYPIKSTTHFKGYINPKFFKYAVAQSQLTQDSYALEGIYLLDNDGDCSIHWAEGLFVVHDINIPSLKMFTKNNFIIEKNFLIS